MKRKIKDKLREQGLNPKSAGFNYMADCIEILIKRIGNPKKISLKNDVFAILAKKYQVENYTVSAAVYNLTAKVPGIDDAGVDFMIRIIQELGYNTEKLTFKRKSLWTQAEDKTILNNPTLSAAVLATLPELSRRTPRAINYRRTELKNKKQQPAPEPENRVSIFEEPVYRPPRPEPGVVLNQAIKLKGRAGKVDYIHPEGYYYHVTFNRGGDATVNSYEFKEALTTGRVSIPWLEANESYS